MASGELKLIENLDVRDKLIELEEVYENLRIHEDMYLEYLTDDLPDAFIDNFDLIENKLINEEYYAKVEYRNLIAVFHALNLTRLDQYKLALPKAMETMELLKRELGVNK